MSNKNNNDVTIVTNTFYLTKLFTKEDKMLNNNENNVVNQYKYTDTEILNGIAELKSDISNMSTNTYELKYFLNIQSKSNINNSTEDIVYMDEIKMFKQFESNYYMYEVTTEIMDTLCFPNLNNYDTRINYEETVINLKSLPNIQIIIKKYGKNNNSISIKLDNIDKINITNILEKVKYLM